MERGKAVVAIIIEGTALWSGYSNNCTPEDR